MSDQWPTVLKTTLDHEAWTALCRVRMTIEVNATVARVQTGTALRQFAQSLGVQPKLAPYWTANVQSMLKVLAARREEFKRTPRLTDASR